ncbi:unnamed protein product [Heligmosomoides polygyrus]|uniref:Uncharacterized protein n=1 Tax=Heligmosomoides polygyrus TaxID=6339 RepID=A0A183GSA3_HELPZ|nr:unnamed protein product [Heligmosomoides polygyrus]
MNSHCGRCGACAFQIKCNCPDGSKAGVSCAPAHAVATFSDRAIRSSAPQVFLEFPPEDNVVSVVQLPADVLEQDKLNESHQDCAGMCATLNEVVSSLLMNKQRSELDMVKVVVRDLLASLPKNDTVESLTKRSILQGLGAPPKAKSIGGQYKRVAERGPAHEASSEVEREMSEVGPVNENEVEKSVAEGSSTVEAAAGSTPVKRFVIADSDDDITDDEDNTVRRPTSERRPFAVDHDYAASSGSNVADKLVSADNFPIIPGLSELGLVSDDFELPPEQHIPPNRLPAAHLGYDQREPNIINRFDFLRTHGQ